MGFAPIFESVLFVELLQVLEYKCALPHAARQSPDCQIKLCPMILVSNVSCPVVPPGLNLGPQMVGKCSVTKLHPNLWSLSYLSLYNHWLLVAFSLWTFFSLLMQFDAFLPQSPACWLYLGLLSCKPSCLNVGVPKGSIYKLPALMLDKIIFPCFYMIPF